MRKNRREFLKTSGAALGTTTLASTFSLAPTGAQRPPADKRPNILFFFPDQQRFDWVGTHPDIPVRTPNLDALGKRGVRFERAVCAAPVCAPSRACLAAGVEYDRCGVASNQFDFPLDRTTFYKLLRDSGYHVTGCGKFDLSKKTKDWGLDGKNRLAEWGFSDGVNSSGKWDGFIEGSEEPTDPYMAYLHENGLAESHLADYKKRRGRLEGYSVTEPTPLPEEAYCDNWVANKGLELIRNAPADKPWFLQINFPGPHPPVDITHRMEKLARGFDHPQPHGNTELDEETHNRLRQNYSAMIENIDRWLGIYVKELAERGELDNTSIVYSSDHGEMLGDHDLWSKSKPHQPSIGVPLSAAGPGVQPIGACNALVSVMDLASTFLDIGGVATPSDMDSRTFKSILEGNTKDHREILFSGLHDFRTAFDGRYKLVLGYPEKKDVALYDMANDPWEDENLASERKDDVARLRRAIEEELGYT
jgi:arylsulfatase A-like enzyme